GAGHDYQVKIVVYFGAGVDSGDVVYCGNYCRTDFGDIFFTDNDGVTELAYWMEDFYPSENATFWVKLKDTLDYDQSIYLYFGNPDQPSVSDGESTFIVWDDFDDGYSQFDAPSSLRGWSIVNQGGDICRIENNPVGRSGMGLRYTEDGAGGLNLHLFNIWEQTDHDIAVHFDFYWETRVRQFYWNVYDIDDWFPSVTLLSDSPDYDWLYYTDDAWYEYQNGLEPSPDIWYDLEQQTDMDDGLNTTLVINGIEYPGANNEDAVDGFDCVRFAAHHDYVDDYYIDDFYVRKFVPSEPSNGLWGVLESAMSIDSPADLTYEAGTIGHRVDWTVFSYHPYRYLRMLNYAILVNATWDGSDVGISVDGLDPGSHSFTLQIFNTLGYSLIDSVTVNVEDTTDPVLTHPESVEYTEGTPGNTIEWTMDDLYPSSYELHIDSDLLLSGDWNTTGESLTISVDGLPAGLYNFSLAAIDESGNSAIDYVTVTVQPNYTTIILMVGVAGVVLIIGVISCRAKKS
ncbi:MAG: DUF2341 domain-containing protein, partial [Candidatus Thorarchaeota archaeon]